MRIQIKQLWGNPGELLETHVYDLSTGEPIEGIERIEISRALGEDGQSQMSAKLFMQKKPAHTSMTMTPIMEAEIMEANEEERTNP